MGVGELLWSLVIGIGVVFRVGIVTVGLTEMEGEGLKRSLLIGVLGEET